VTAANGNPERVGVLEPYGFEPSAGAWRPGIHRSITEARSLTLVTFNLWFDQYHWEERLDATLSLIATCRADVVGLQEVTPRQLDRILSTEWVRHQYQVSDVSAKTLQPHGVVLLSRSPISSLALCPLPSGKDRKLLVAELLTGCGSLYVGTVHLESSPENTARRLEQLDRVLPGLYGADHAVLMGDFNFDPRHRSEQSRIEHLYTDLWTSLRGDEPGYTADSERNAMRFMHKQLHKRVRFDRILLRSKGNRWRPISINLLGTDPVSAERPEIYASDHFGVCGVVACGG